MHTNLVLSDDLPKFGDVFVNLGSTNIFERLISKQINHDYWHFSVSYYGNGRSRPLTGRDRPSNENSHKEVGDCNVILTRERRIETKETNAQYSCAMQKSYSTEGHLHQRRLT